MVAQEPPLHLPYPGLLSCCASSGTLRIAHPPSLAKPSGHHGIFCSISTDSSCNNLLTAITSLGLTLQRSSGVSQCSPRGDPTTILQWRLPHPLHLPNSFAPAILVNWYMLLYFILSDPSDILCMAMQAEVPHRSLLASAILCTAMQAGMSRPSLSGSSSSNFSSSKDFSTYSRTAVMD